MTAATKLQPTREALARILQLGAQSSAKCDWLARDFVTSAIARLAELETEASAGLAGELGTTSLAYARLEAMLPELELRLQMMVDMLDGASTAFDALVAGAQRDLASLPEPAERTLTADTSKVPAWHFPPRPPTEER